MIFTAGQLLCRPTQDIDHGFHVVFFQDGIGQEQEALKAVVKSDHDRFFRKGNAVVHIVQKLGDMDALKALVPEPAEIGLKVLGGQGENVV